MTKKFTVFLCAMLLLASVHAQKILVSKTSNRLKGKNTDGYVVALSGIAADINAALLKYLKTLGKARADADWVTVAGFTINGNFHEGVLYATARVSGLESSAWFGINPSEWSQEGADSVQHELENLAYDFGIVYYRNLIQADIDQSVQALQAVERQQQRLSIQYKELNIKLDDNNREKTQLDKALESNKLEHAVILTHLEENKKAQDSLAVSSDKIKSVIESQKEKQKKVGSD